MGERILDTTNHPKENLGPNTTIKFYEKSTLQANIDYFHNLCYDITLDATGMPEGTLVEGQRDSVEKWDFLLILEKEGQAIGYAGFRVIDLPQGRLFEGAGKMVRKLYQASGYGEILTRDAAERVDEIDYVGLRVQNPASYRSFKKVFPDFIFAPIDVSYPDDPELQGVLQTLVNEGHMSSIDVATGVSRGTYQGRRFGDYRVDILNPSIAAIEQQLQNAGLNREAGDGVYIVGKKQH